MFSSSGPGQLIEKRSFESPSFSIRTDERSSTDSAVNDEIINFIQVQKGIKNILTFVLVVIFHVNRVLL